VLMSEQEYRRLVRKRQLRGAPMLFADAAPTEFFRQAARSVRRRERAQKALEAALDPTWLGVTHIEALTDATLTLAVSNPVVCKQLRREAGRLQKGLAGRIGGVQQVVVRYVGQPPLVR
jgi:hypothetical protein